ncbi:MAG: SoxR reducing system RseC family protein [Thermodesulfobacteriota bacterium]|nr:SoxR reducing system RseC family protein [Thermodesulfobacteriota bacterium]
MPNAEPDPFYDGQLISGLIVGIEKDEAIVHVERRSACQGCEASNICHAFVKPNMEFRLKRPKFDIRAGDKVTIAMEDSSFLKACAIAYLIPLVSIVLAIFITKTASMNEAIQAISAVCAFLGSLLIIRRLGAGIKGPRILEVIHEDRDKKDLMPK